MSNIIISDLKHINAIQFMGSNLLSSIRGGADTCSPQTITQRPDGSGTILCKDGRTLECTSAGVCK
jgi:hypothetical protein